MSQSETLPLERDEDALEEALYGTEPLIRDRGRAEIIRSGSVSDIERLVHALFASLDVTRRRATRLLSDLQPHRALPPLKEWVTQLASRGWQEEAALQERALEDALVSAARLLNQLTPRGQREETLALLLKAPMVKVQRVSVCPATPSQALVTAIISSDIQVTKSAYQEAFRRLSSLADQLAEERAQLSELLRGHLTEESFKSFIEEVSAASVTPDKHLLQARGNLFSLLYPEHELWSYAARRGYPIGLRFCTTIKPLIEAVENILADDPAQDKLLSALVALERATRLKGTSARAARSNERRDHPEDHSIPELSRSALVTLSRSERSEVRALLARLISPDDELLTSLLSDEDEGVRWCASQLSIKSFESASLRSRLGAHQRLTLPSAQPPYGLRAFDKVPEIQRVNGALALCQSRFDVNLGVAMRSAEAAGLREVVVVGVKAGVLTSARGAEYALPIHWLNESRDLIDYARREGYQLVAVQQTPNSQPYHLADYPPRPLFILGSEDAGLPDELRIAADLAVEIPLFGAIDSLNVATAATCVIMHWRVHLE